MNYLPEVETLAWIFFFNVGTNDGVTPGLLELGARYPDFPVYIVPGGQHGGPGTAGFTRRVPLLDAVNENLMSFARYHFFKDRSFVDPPKVEMGWNDKQRTLTVTGAFSRKKWIRKKTTFGGQSIKANRAR